MLSVNYLSLESFRLALPSQSIAATVSFSFVAAVWIGRKNLPARKDDFSFLIHSYKNRFLQQAPREAERRKPFLMMSAFLVLGIRPFSLAVFSHLFDSDQRRTDPWFFFFIFYKKNRYWLKAARPSKGSIG